MARRRSSGRRRRKSDGRLRNWIAGLALLALLLHFSTSPPRAVRRWWSEHQGIVRVEGHSAAILAAAGETGLDPNLLAGVMMVESRGRVDAQSGAGALGLFQLMLPTAQERALLLGVEQPSKQRLLSDAGLNVRLGAHYLDWLLGRCGGDEERALIAYNAGPGRLQRWIDEAGSYAAWRDARERAGNSPLLAYVRDVQHYRQRFADRGIVAPRAGPEVPNPSLAPDPSAAPAEPLPAQGPVVPAAPVHQQ